MVAQAESEESIHQGRPRLPGVLPGACAEWKTHEHPPVAVLYDRPRPGEAPEALAPWASQQQARVAGACLVVEACCAEHLPGAAVQAG